MHPEPKHRFVGITGSGIPLLLPGVSVTRRWHLSSSRMPPSLITGPRARTILRGFSSLYPAKRESGSLLPRAAFFFSKCGTLHLVSCSIAYCLTSAIKRNRSKTGCRQRRSRISRRLSLHPPFQKKFRVCHLLSLVLTRNRIFGETPVRRR